MHFVSTGRGHQIFSRSLLLKGRIEEALDHARQSMTAYRKTEYVAGMIEANISLAEAHAAAGAWDQALKHSADAVKRATDYPSDLWLFDALYMDLQVRGGRHQHARDAGTLRAAREALSKVWKIAESIDARLETTHNGDRIQEFWKQTTARSG